MDFNQLLQQAASNQTSAEKKVIIVHDWSPSLSTSKMALVTKLGDDA